MKLQHDWRRHVDRSTEDLAGLRRPGRSMRPLMAVAIIITLAGSVIALGTSGMLPVDFVEDSMLIAA